LNTNQRGLRLSFQDAVQQFRTILRRTAELQQDPTTSTPRQRELLTQQIQELSAALDQLQQESGQPESSGKTRTAQDIDHDLFDCAPAGYIVTDSRGVIHQANRAAAALLKVQQKFLTDLALDVFIPDDRQAVFQAKLGELRTASAAQSFELSVQPRRGEPVAVVAAVSRGPEDELRWILHDVTAIVQPLRAQAEAEKRQKEQVIRQAQITQTQADEIAFRASFLAEASEILTSSFDDENNLIKVMHLAVPRFADCCIAYNINDEGTIEHLGIVVKDPAREAVLRELDSHYLRDTTKPHPVLVMLQQGKSMLWPAIDNI
jgi:PAS domain S-box-containing protein